MTKQELPKKLQKLLDGGIRVCAAIFRDAVNNSDGTPEFHFSETTNVPSRNVRMTWTSAGLICEHKNKYFVVPESTVKYANFKLEDSDN